MEDFEKRANDAEKLLQSLQKRVGQIERASAAESTGDTSQLRAYQADMLVKLRAVRASLVQEGDLTTLKAERDAAVSENAGLREALDKANYRIMHLKRSLEAEEAKNGGGAD